MVDSRYFSSFGMLEDGVVYYNPENTPEQNATNLKALKTHLFNVVDKYKVQLKALETTTGGAGYAGNALVPVYVDPTIVDRSRKFTPVRNMLKRVTNQGTTASYNVITEKGGATTAAEGATLTETDDTYARENVDIKYLYAVGKVTGQAIAAIPGYNIVGTNVTGSGNGNAVVETSFANNALQTEVFIKMRSLAELEEGLLINGNATTSVYGGANGTEFDGIVQIMGTTNTKDLGGTGSLTEAGINEAISYAFIDSGRPDFAICDASTFVDLQSILADKKVLYQNMDVTAYGTIAVNWMGMTGAIKVYPSQFLTATPGSKSMYFIDSSVWEIRVLQDATYEELAKTADFKKFMIKEYITLICRAPSFNSSITNIA